MIKRVGQAVVLLSVASSWDILFESLEQFSDDFMSQRNQPKLHNKRGRDFSLKVYASILSRKNLRL